MRILLLSLLGAAACGGGQSPPPDATVADDSTNITCVDDSSFEPNESTGAPFSLGEIQQIALIATICPEGDFDVYEWTIPQPGLALTGILVFENGAPLEVALLDAGGAPIAGSSPAGANEARLTFAGPPTGPVFVQVVAPGGGRNNYRLELALQ